MIKHQNKNIKKQQIPWATDKMVCYKDTTLMFWFSPTSNPCFDPESFFRVGPTLTTLFLNWWVDPNTTEIGPSSARQRTVSLACQRWPNIECWLGSFVIFRGSGTVWYGTLYFCVFSGGPGPPVPPLWIHACNLSPSQKCKQKYILEKKHNNITSITNKKNKEPWQYGN